jgi:uncharacterized membrane protein
MKQNFEYRKAALDLLKGNWADVIVISIFIFILEAIAQSTFFFVIPKEYNGFATLAMNLILFFPLVYTLKILLLALSRTGKKVEIGTYLATFKTKYSKAVPVMGLMCVYVILWTFLLIIPGIIKGYSYAMAPYISIDNEDLSPEECIQKSMQMMEGHKMQLFLLDLSFIGWAFLSILTMGIGLLWLAPYQETARLKFYEDLKAQVA